MHLTSEEILLIFSLIKDKYGDGYADDPKIAALQGHLSLLLEMARKRES